MSTLDCPSVCVKFNHEAVARPTAELLSFVERIIAQRTAYNGPEKRAERRRSLAEEALVIPVDMHVNPCGEPFMAVTRDLSGSGISLYHTAAPTSDFLALELVDVWGGKLQAVMQVLRVQPNGPYFEIAGSIVMTLEQAP